MSDERFRGETMMAIPVEGGVAIDSMTKLMAAGVAAAAGTSDKKLIDELAADPEFREKVAAGIARDGAHRQLLPSVPVDVIALKFGCLSIGGDGDGRPRIVYDDAPTRSDETPEFVIAKICRRRINTCTEAVRETLAGFVGQTLVPAVLAKIEAEVTVSVLTALGLWPTHGAPLSLVTLSDAEKEEILKGGWRDAPQPVVVTSATRLDSEPGPG